jgi:hypothetical protein
MKRELTPDEQALALQIFEELRAGRGMPMEYLRSLILDEARWMVNGGEPRGLPGRFIREYFIKAGLMK